MLASALRRTQVFDTLSRLDELRGANGQLTEYDYDAQGNRVAQTQAGAFSTLNRYDALNRVIEVSDAASGVTEYGYNALDQRTSVKDPLGLTTRYTYNAFGDVLTQVSPDTGTTTYTYDSAGNLKARTDARGVLTQYRYDALNRLTQTTYPADPTRNITWTWDGTAANAKGRLTKTATVAEVQSFTYDPRGNLLKNTRVSGGVTLTTQYLYDPADRLTRITYPGGRYIRYDRDTAGQINKVRMTSGTTTVNLATSIAHLPFGPISTLNLPNGANSRPTYDQDYRRTRINDSDVLDRALSYDTRDLITGISDALNPARSQTYGYDALARLTSASSAASYGTQSWTYDANANRQTETRNAATDSYTLIPGSQRLQSISGSRNVNYAYDPSGHLTSDGTRSYTADVAGRLSAIQSGATTLMQAQYTPEGTRQSKTAAGITHRYVYDQTGHLLADISPTGTINAEYVWLEDQPLALIATRSGGTAKEIFYFHNDHLGTPQRLTDSTKAVVWDAVYEPFGKASLTTNLVENPIRLPGQFFDAESGLHQNWMRDYSPPDGRYIESDPIGLRGGINTYGYALQNPISFSDPFGLDAEMCHRPIQGYIIPGRHCFARFNGDSSDTSSFTPQGVGPDAARDGAACEKTNGDQNDDCVKREMKKCKDYSFLGNNCCHCVEDAMKACGQTLPPSKWPNWPINPGPQQGEPGYKP